MLKELNKSWKILEVFIYLWIIQIESKLKAALESVIDKDKLKSSRYNAEFYSKNFSDKVIPKNIINDLKKAKNKFIRNRSSQ